MDKLDIKYSIKKFFKAIFRDELKSNEFIRLVQLVKGKEIIKFFNDIDTLVEYCTNNRFGINTYFQLTTVNGKSGKSEDLLFRSCLGFDFDKNKLNDLTAKDILQKFKDLNLWYHCLVDSGHGYHAYVCIEKTDDLDKVHEVQKVLATKLGADLNAIKRTQLLRPPLTYNIKNSSNVKQVNIIKLFDKLTIKPYSIEKLYKRFCYNDSIAEAIDNTLIKLAIKNNNIPSCVVKILEEGSITGSRNADLQKIVVTFRRRNKSLNEVKYICKQWNSNNKDTLPDVELEYQTQYMYNNLNNCNYNCAVCDHTHNCFDTVLSDFQHSDAENLITMNETHIKSLKASKRKGAKTMEGNGLLIYCILKNHSDGLYRDEIIRDMTYKKKCRFSKDTITKTLSNLEQNGFIEAKTICKKKLYMVSSTKNKVELTYNVSFAATYECIKGTISTEELRLYNYMRYIHNYTQRNNPKALKGNLLQVNQIDLAKDLGITQGRVSQMIHNLIEEKMLGIWYRQSSKNNGFEFNIYKLNY